MSWYDIISAVVIAIVVFVGTGVLAFNQKWEELRRIAKYLMEKAEKYITGTKRGQERFEHVLDIIYNLFMPDWIKWIVDKETFREFLQEWYNEAKDYLNKIKAEVE